MARSILLVEDSEVTAQVYHAYLTQAGYRVHLAATIKRAAELAAAEMPEAAIIDMQLPDGNGIDLLGQLKADYPSMLLIMVTAHGTVDYAVQAIQHGAHDFIQKPFSSERLLTTLRNALALTDLRREIKRLGTVGEAFHDFVGDNVQMQAVYRVIEQVAASRAPVFITGESGTGKELAARALHAASPRASKPFKALNCAAIPKDLLESELFGHVKGAFTGATETRTGAAMAANGGTLFLDEICDMPLDLQVKLLRLIQTQIVQPVGSDKEVKIDVRFVAATNKAPWAMVEAGRFREDLYYRLNVVPVEMPPLRARPDDIDQLARYFLGRYAAEEGKALPGFTEAARRKLARFSWPGNVRQLENAVRYAVAMAESGEIDEGHLPALTTEAATAAAKESEGPVTPLWQAEKQAIEQALRQTDDDVGRAASLLEVAPSTIYRKLQQWKQPV